MMTEAEIITMTANDPLVLDRNGKRRPDGSVTPISAQAMKARVVAGMPVTLNAIFTNPMIRARLFERTESLSVSTTTDEGRGAILTLPKHIASVLSIISSDVTLPLKKLTSREEFDYWYSERYASLTASDTPEVWVPWDLSEPDRLPQILLSPGKGSGDTIKISYVRRVNQPPKLSDLPDDTHWLVQLDLKNRMSGNAYERELKEALSSVGDRLDRAPGSPTSMPLDPMIRRMNQHLSSMTGDGDRLSDYPESRRPY